MKYLANSLIAKKIDTISTEEFFIPSVVLMERASLCTAEEIMKDTDCFCCKVLVVSGRGNNGGDAMATGRILLENGYDVDLYVSADVEKLSDLAQLQYRIAIKSGIKIKNVFNPEDYDIIIDGLFGIGLNKEIQGQTAELIEKINASSKKVFSIDIPSGINASNGNIMGKEAIKAYKTITYGIMKTGLVLYPGADYAGKTIVADIGFPQKAVAMSGAYEFFYENSDLKDLPKRKNLSNKGTYGKTLIIAGSPGMCGAAFLSGKAAYRSGCGLVRILSCVENTAMLHKMIPEAIISTPDDIEECINWADSIAIGPGIGINTHSKELLKKVLISAKCNIVVDADAINIIASDNEIRKLFMQVSKKIIITPHLKEMTRLVDCSIETIRKDISSFALQHAGETVLVLKDAVTVVSDGRRNYINCYCGNNGMATGGSGDVLTGIIASILAQGADRYSAASFGVYIHALAGDAAVEKMNKHALMAGDIIEALGDIPYMEE